MKFCSEVAQRPPRDNLQRGFVIHAPVVFNVAWQVPRTHTHTHTTAGRFLIHIDSFYKQTTSLDR